MAFSSSYEGNYKTWGRMIAARGVAVAMVDFRNSVHPDSASEVAPFPAGLNDCVSGLKWVHANAASLGVDPERIVVAEESGGGNLTLAVGMKLKQDGELGLIKGPYALCPYIVGEWPLPQNPSSTERHPHIGAQQPQHDGLRHRGVQYPQSARMAGLRTAQRC
jgi:acetyl esterase